MARRQGGDILSVARNPLTFLQTIADVVEAIIGAAYLCGGQDNAFQVTKALQVPIPHTEQWDDLRRKASLPPPNPTASLRAGTVEAVEEIVNHKFGHPHVLRSALVNYQSTVISGWLTKRLTDSCFGRGL